MKEIVCLTKLTNWFMTCASVCLFPFLLGTMSSISSFHMLKIVLASLSLSS